MSKEQFFKNIDDYFSRGRGIAIYNCNHSFVHAFPKTLKKTKYKGVSLRVSSLVKNLKIPEINIDKYDFCLIQQDQNLSELTHVIDALMNRIIFPFFYRCKSLIFLTILHKDNDTNEIDSNQIHINSHAVVRQLLIEQLNTMIDYTCINYASPELFAQQKAGHMLTPVEEIMNTALKNAGINSEPQVRVGKYVADFLVETGDNKIIVECDGRDYHNPYKNKERYKEFQKRGYAVCHFTGSEIYHDIGRCIQTITKTSSRSNTTFSIDENLDKSQKKALNHISGPIRVLAPAGSGKTKTLVNRIINLINHDIDPGKILALAFNKRAADEMIERLINKQICVAKKITEKGVIVKTFHSFGYEIIKKELGWNFDILADQKNTRKILENAISKHHKIKYRKNRDILDIYLAALRKAKMELPAIDELFVDDEEELIPFKPIFVEYLRLQNRLNFINFDDMIYLSLRLLLKKKSLRHRLQTKFEYILIDEFQDLNKAQILLMQILALPQNHLFIVGDDDQMIYGWRGAEVSHILKFNDNYSESKNCTLSTNYRSNKRIVHQSRWLIDHNRNRVMKNIQPLPGKPGGIFHIRLSESLWHQADEIVNWMCELKETQHFDWQDFAILFRYNTYQYILAMVLDTYSIPHTSVDHRLLFHTVVGKDIFSLVKLILFPSKLTANDLSRILKKHIKYLSNEIIAQITDWNTFIKSPSLPALQIWQQNELTDFIDKVRAAQSQCVKQKGNPQSFLSTISKKFELKKIYGDHTKQNMELDEASDEILLEVIINVAVHFNSIEKFYEYMQNALSEENRIHQNVHINIRQNEVILSTIHKTKGNEFRNVAYFNLMKNEDLTELSDIEEERRVTYVGVTRAIENILITAPANNGHSPFLEELAFNPEFSNLSTKKLINMLSQMKQLQKNSVNSQEKIENIEFEIKNRSILNIKGLTTKTKYKMLSPQ